MSSDEFDAIVIGAGLMGAATAWSLARRGRSVLLVEQYHPGHNRGSSHGSARIVRRAYSDVLYTRLTGQAFELWRELEESSGTRILRMHGGLDHGANHDVDAVAERLAAEAVAHELLRSEAAEERWPGMRFEGSVLFHPQAGTMDAALAVEAFVDEAVRHGVRVLQETRVVAVLPGDGRSEIELAGGERVAARAVVVAAGGWAEPLLHGRVTLPPLAVTQQQIFHFPRLDTDAEQWPSVIHDELTPVYHLAGGRDGGPGEDRKIAEHRHGTATTASRAQRHRRPCLTGADRGVREALAARIGPDDRAARRPACTRRPPTRTSSSIAPALLWSAQRVPDTARSSHR